MAPVAQRKLYDFLKVNMKIIILRELPIAFVFMALPTAQIVWHMKGIWVLNANPGGVPSGQWGLSKFR